jgi:hypothetical protein
MDLYHYGCMGNINDLHKLIGNSYCFMHTTITVNPTSYPAIWLEITLFDKTSNQELNIERYQMSQFPKQKGPNEANLPNTPTFQNDQPKYAHEMTTEQDLPPLHSVYLTSFDTSTHSAQSNTIHNNQTNITDTSTTDSTAYNAKAWWSGKLTTKRLEQFASTVLPSSVQVQLA